MTAWVAPAQAGTVTFPAKAAFVYNWFSTSTGSACTSGLATSCTPQAGWNQQGVNPFTQYHPLRGWYDSSNTSVINAQQTELANAHQDVAILSWFGKVHRTDDNNIIWHFETAGDGGGDPDDALYYECEGNPRNTSDGSCPGNPTTGDLTDPSIPQIRNDLNWINSRYVDAAYAHAPSGGGPGGIKPVIFVYGDGEDGDVSTGEDPAVEHAEGCDMVQRWTRANQLAEQSFYIVLKIFPGYLQCGGDPDPANPSDVWSYSRRVDSWHQYAPASRTQTAPRVSSGLRPYSMSISPGFRRGDDPWPPGGTTCASNSTPPCLDRDVFAFNTAYRTAEAANPDWLLTTTYNEWGEGSAVEAALEWVDPGGPSLFTSVMRDGGSVPSRTNVMMAGGDIAVGGSVADDETADRYFDGAMSNTITLGDNAYDSGTMDEFLNRYHPSWGRFLSTTWPSPGNHDPFGAPISFYDEYFDASAAGVTAGQVPRYYSFDIGDWHIVSLDACGTQQDKTACGPGEDNTPPTRITDDTAQLNWLENDLDNAQFSRPCILVYWHHTRWSNGDSHGDNPITQPFWEKAVLHDVDLVIAGHEHNYERFAKMNLTGATPGNARQFVVGTGGSNRIDGFTANSSAADDAADEAQLSMWGVLKLNLDPQTLSVPGYAWRFVPAPQPMQTNPLPTSWTDTGTTECN